MRTKVSILLDAEHRQYLEREARLRGLSISAVVRDIIAEKISPVSVNQQGTDPVSLVIGKYSSGHRDSARCSKEILYGDNPSK